MSAIHTTIDPTTTLAAIALAEPAASRVFQRLHIDFCCQGRRTLAEVCRDRGISAADVVSTIEQSRGDVAASFDAATAPVGTLIDQGDADPFLAEQLKPELLAKAAKAGGQKITLRMQPGYDHSYFFMASFMADHVAFHAERLKGPA